MLECQGAETSPILGGPPPESLIVVPCTQADTIVLVDYAAQKLAIQTSKVRYNFPFNKCSITSIWEQPSLSDPGRLSRRAVLRVQAYSLWSFTLAPECSVHEQDILYTLQDALNPTGLAARTSTVINTPVFPLGLPSQDRPTLIDWDDIIAVASPLTRIAAGHPSTSILADLIRDPIGLILGICRSPARTSSISLDLSGSKDLFGGAIRWDDEPVFLRTLFCVRDGQSEEESNDAFLTRQGTWQIAFGAAYLYLLLGASVSHIQTVISSISRSAQQSSEILAGTLERYKWIPSASISRFTSGLLRDGMPPYAYKFDDNVTESTRKTIISDGERLEEARGLFSAAIRGQGQLMTAVPPATNPATLAGNSQLQSTSGDDQLLMTYRFPCMSGAPAKIAGVHIGHAEATKSSIERGPRHAIYVAHCNVMRYCIFEEVGFPKDFWLRAHMFNGAVVIMGLRVDGQPALILGDAGATLRNASTLTFTPRIMGALAGRETTRRRLLGESTAELLKEKEWYKGETPYSGVRVNTVTTAKFKQIVMIRTGHNIEELHGDVGLSEIGVTQMKDTATALGQMMTAQVLGPPRSKWCTAGLTSEWSVVNTSLKESIVEFKKVFPAAMSTPEDDSMISDENELFPDRLFAAPAEGGELFVIFADEYHLLKYFGACFGIDPSALRRIYWPHAGFVCINISTEGFAYLPTFGTVTHIPAQLLTYRSARPRTTASTPKASKRFSISSDLPHNGHSLDDPDIPFFAQGLPPLNPLNSLRSRNSMSISGALLESPAPSSERRQDKFSRGTSLSHSKRSMASIDRRALPVHFDENTPSSASRHTLRMPSSSHDSLSEGEENRPANRRSFSDQRKDRFSGTGKNGSTRVSAETHNLHDDAPSFSSSGSLKQ